MIEEKLKEAELKTQMWSAGHYVLWNDYRDPFACHLCQTCAYHFLLRYNEHSDLLDEELGISSELQEKEEIV